MDWLRANQQYLIGSLVEIRHALECAAGMPDEADAGDLDPAELASLRADLAAERDGGAALDRVCQLFDLTPFERGVLLLCVGMELDGRFAGLCGTALHEDGPSRPTFGLAMSVLAQPDWAAALPERPLRRWQLLHLDDERYALRSPLRVDERILHILAGYDAAASPLSGLATLVEPSEHLVDSHARIADHLAHAWSAAPDLAAEPILHLYGPDPRALRSVAALACHRVGRALMRVRSNDIPANRAELDSFLRQWEREAVFSNTALLVECEPEATQESADSQPTAGVRRLVDEAGAPLLLASRERMALATRPTVSVEVHRPTAAEQASLWTASLGDLVVGDQDLQAVVSQFNLSQVEIEAACAEAHAASEDGAMSSVRAILWEAARAQARPRLGALAQHIRSNATQADLVVPEPIREVLRELVIHVQQRRRVNDDWGFANRGTRGLGISALFAGSSGTGKTLAAEVLANELQLDLYRIDLSSTISKYIGETEKNVRHIFDAAESGGAILLFDEADALFGKRSEVKDSHDRYANIEVSYLLQRMEAYSGLAILTTNMDEALDTAFLRRIRFIGRFPFPDQGERAEIWRRVFPSQLPRGDIDLDKLARLNVAGGTIRSIALGAAGLAAANGGVLNMEHVLRATRTEYTKLNRPLPWAELVDAASGLRPT